MSYVVLFCYSAAIPKTLNLVLLGRGEVGGVTIHQYYSLAKTKV